MNWSASDAVLFTPGDTREQKKSAFIVLPGLRVIIDGGTGEVAYLNGFHFPNHASLDMNTTARDLVIAHMEGLGETA